MSPKKFQDSSSVGLKQLKLNTFFAVTKTTKEGVKTSNLKTEKKQPKPVRNKRKSPKKKKVADLESEDEECESYSSAKTQRENSRTCNAKVVALNKPTPLKKNYNGYLKIEQVKRNITKVCQFSLSQRESTIEPEVVIIEMPNAECIEITDDEGTENSIQKETEVSGNESVARKARRSFEEVEDEGSKESPKKIKTEDSSMMVNEKNEPVEVFSVVKRKLFIGENIFEKTEAEVKIQGVDSNDVEVESNKITKAEIERRDNVKFEDDMEINEVKIERLNDPKNEEENNVKREDNVNTIEVKEVITEGQNNLKIEKVNEVEIEKKDDNNIEVKGAAIEGRNESKSKGDDENVEKEDNVKFEEDFIEINKVKIERLDIVKNEDVKIIGVEKIISVKTEEIIKVEKGGENAEINKEFATIEKGNLGSEAEIKEDDDVDLDETIINNGEFFEDFDEISSYPENQTSKEFAKIVEQIEAEVKKEEEDVDLGEAISNYGEIFVDFNEVLSYVENQPNLLSMLYEEEQKFLKRFIRLHEKYRYFCFRLFIRQLIWHDVESLREKIRLRMNGIMFRKMIKTLEEMEIVHTDYTKEEPIDLLNRLTVNHVKTIYQSFKLKTKCSKKEEYIKAILKHCSSQTTLTFAKSSDDLLMDRIREKMGDRVKLDLKFYNMLSRVHLLYSFMNPDLYRPTDLYNFKGSVRRGENILPMFSTDFTNIFTREEFFRYFIAVEQYNEFMIAKEHNNEKKMLKIAKLAFEDFKQLIKDGHSDEETTVLNFHKRFTGGRVLAKVLSMACKQFTRDSDLVMEWLEFLVKQNRYALKMRGDWYNHIAMIREKRKEFEWAIDTLIEALVDPNVSDVSKHDLSYRANRLLKKCDDEETKAVLSDLILPPPDEIPFPTTLLRAAKIEGGNNGRDMRVQFNLNGFPVCVENYALNHYQQNGYPRGIHTEGRLMTIMYILLFWEIIFEKYVPGTFVSEIQYIPLDFFSPDFYENRKKEIDLRLMDIERGWSMEELVEQLEENISLYGNIYTLTGIVDDCYRDILIDAVKCIERTVLRKIFERFLKNFRDYRAGMPDLFVCNPITQKCKFVEVKSENDTLSMKQMVWLDYLRSAGADIEVCHIYSEGSKVKKKLLKEP